ncbi:MAG TPA: hypothetical protein VMJ10_34185 [Kofleriaceae bacterium]|nr:hypothetical protein [Kofleriaceae bacterium]
MRHLLWLWCVGCGFQHGMEGGDGTQTGSDAAAPDGRALDGRPGDARPIDALDGPPPPVTFVQGASGTFAGNTVTLTLSTAQHAGDLDIVALSWTTGTTVQSVTDSDNNTYALVATTVSPGVGTLGVYYAENVAQGVGADTITVKLSGSSNPVAVAAAYRGLATTDALDVEHSAYGTSTAPNSGNATTTHAHDLLVGIPVSSVDVTAGTGFTTHVDANLDIVEDREVTTTGGYSATATLGSNAVWLATLAAFAAAS